LVVFYNNTAHKNAVITKLTETTMVTASEVPAADPPGAVVDPLVVVVLPTVMLVPRPVVVPGKVVVALTIVLLLIGVLGRVVLRHWNLVKPEQTLSPLRLFEAITEQLPQPEEVQL